MTRNFFLWILPLILILLITPFTPWIDMSVSGYFHDKNFFVHNAFFDFIYRYGLYPAWFVVILSIAGLAFSYRIEYLRRYQRALWLTVLVFVIGAGIITNVLFKEHWGRPRPVQVSEFGGHDTFHPYYSPNLTFWGSERKSFPSGHATLGFYFFSFVVLGSRYKKRTLWWAGIVMVCILGGALSIARIAQGGHFPSDVIGSAAIMWYTALITDMILYRRYKQ